MKADVFRLLRGGANAGLNQRRIFQQRQPALANGGELLQDCVQLHGGIGVTFDHDLHLFLRRVTTNIPLFGSPAQHAVRISTILESQVGV